mgnify:CR=1 FL=1
MKTYQEPAKEILVSREVDVLVVGSGPAGIGAAIRAGRAGAKTMLIESQGCVGGIATAGMMSHWGGKSSSRIYQEIIQKSMNMRDIDDGMGCEINAIHHEQLKFLLFDLLKQAHVEVLLYTFACGVIVENGILRGVIVENKTGRSLILAKNTVDATGDGDVAAMAGVPYTLGRETDHKMQPCTVMFKVGGVDTKRAVFPGSFETLVNTDIGELQALAKETLPFPAGHVLLYKTPHPSVVCCNMTNCINTDGSKAEDLTSATYTCYSQMGPIISFLRKYVPGYENCYLLTAASLLGIRETRHFTGLSTLQSDDILQAHYHEDWAVREAFFNFDVHNLDGASLDKTGIQRNWQQNATYTIPYGCLIPINVDGLLLSGRNISGSHLAHSNFRIMTVCMALGEAAGLAAALCTQQDIRPRDLNVTVLQDIL